MNSKKKNQYTDFYNIKKHDISEIWLKIVKFSDLVIIINTRISIVVKMTTLLPFMYYQRKVYFCVYFSSLVILVLIT